MANPKSPDSLALKIRQGKSIILYELVPPSENKSPVDIEKSVSLIVSLFNNLPVDGINIPQVCEEKRNGERANKITEKIEPAILSNYLHVCDYMNIIINRPVVYLPWEEQKKWLKKTYDNSLHNFVFVGGDSSKVNYPGKSVTETAIAITQDLQSDFPDILLGGITIPTRKNEAEKVIQKTLAGIEFFTSQIIYEPESVKELLQDYWILCLKNKLQPKMICLSFAPVTSKKDIDLLLYLGVKIPEKVYEELTTGWLGMGWRSLTICQNIINDVFHFMKKEGIRIPVGINVGYINRHNFEFSITFLEHLSAYYKKNITEVHKLI